MRGIGWAAVMLLAAGVAARGDDADAKDPVVNRLIVVGPPKVYDDLYLRNLLTSLQAQLAGIRGVDQATLLGHIGVAQGADLRQTSVALSASGPPTPQVSTFSLPSGGPTFSAAGIPTTTTPGTTTTTSPVTPAAPAPAAPTLAMPGISSLGQSSLDTYNESLQLSSELNNTALLLNGALSDQLTRGGAPKATVTIGFPVTIEPPSRADRDLENAVAEVQVTFCSNSKEDPPSVVTLLPRERSYNVASLVDKSFLGSVSGVLGGFMNVGGGFLWSHKTYYLVQQQETIAFLRKPAACEAESAAASSATFAWQIHPVLGKKFIRPGNSVNFVQMAIPAVLGGQAAQVIGTACVTVAWREGDKHGGYLGQDIPAATGQSAHACYQVRYYSSATMGRAEALSVTDIGQGAVTVKVAGTFLPGTTVRIGNAFIVPDSITAAHDTLTFTAPATAIVAAGKVFLVGRDGRQTELVRPGGEAGAGRLITSAPTVTPHSDSQSLVQIQLRANHETFSNPAVDPWVVVIGGKVFGLSDAPFLWEDRAKNQISLIVPTGLLQSAASIEVRRLLWRDQGYRDSWPITADMFDKKSPSVAKASILSTSNGLTLALAGTGLDRLRLVYPSATECPTCKTEAMSPMLLRVSLAKAAPPKPPPTTETTAKKAAKHPRTGARIRRNAAPRRTAAPPAAAVPPRPDPTDGLKQLVFCQKAAGGDACDPNFPLLLVDVPKADAPTSKSTPGLKDHKPVPVNTRHVIIEGAMLDQVISIQHGKSPLEFRLTPGDEPSLAVDLPDDMATVPGGYSLLVTFADKSTIAYLLNIQKGS